MNYSIISFGNSVNNFAKEKYKEEKELVSIYVGGLC